MTSRYLRIFLDHREDLDGWAVGHNMRRPGSLQLDRFSHWMWWMLTRNAQNEQERAKIKAELWQPPLGAVTAEKPIDPRSPWSPENESKGFSALKAQLSPGNVPA